MPTNLNLDPDLVTRVLELSGERTKEAAVTLALEEFVALREQRRVLDLAGAVDWDQSYDHKSGRSRGA